MSHAEYIAYLNAVKDKNIATIEANNISLYAYETSITGLRDQIAAYESQITVVEAANDQLVTDNAMIDSIIALL